jgi:amidohydrolase
MIEDGVLDNPKVDYSLALHMWNERPLGWIGISSGPSMAGGEIFKIKVIGKGGHGAAPHLAIDPILGAAQVISAVQGIVAREVPPLQSAVVSICTIHGGETFNVIPPSVEMTGTIRTFEPSIRDLVLQRFEQTVRSAAESAGCQVELEVKRLTPAVINHAPLALQVQQSAQHLFPDDMIDSTNYTTMGSEDMAYIMEKVPGCFFFIGSANDDKNLNASHHHPKFDFDEEALPRAVALMVQVVVDLLHK